MNLIAAQAFLTRDRRDWTKPHLSWLPSSLYRNYLEARRK